MAIRTFNSVGGFSVGETPETIILANGDITTDFGTFTANLAAGNVKTDNLLHSDGTPWDFQLPAGTTNGQLQYYLNGDFGASANLSFDPATSLLTVTGNITTTKNLAAGNVKTDNLLHSDGTPWDFQLPAGSTNGQIQYYLNGDFGASTNFVFDPTSNVLTVTGNVAATNVSATGNINATGNMTAVKFTGNLVGNVQGNIAVTGALDKSIAFINGSNISTSSNLQFDYSTNVMTLTGNLFTTNANLGNLVTANYFHGVIDATSSSQPNIHAVGNLTSLLVDTNANAANVYTTNVSVSGRVLTSLIPSNDNTSDLGSASLQWRNVFAGSNVFIGSTLGYIRAIGNVIQVDALTAANRITADKLTVANEALLQGDVTVSGNLTVGGTTTYINVASLDVKDPLISLGGSGSGANLAHYDGYDRGLWLRNRTSDDSAVNNQAFYWNTGNSEFRAMTSVVVDNFNTVTSGTYANIHLEKVIGNLSGTVLTSSQPYITSVGTLDNLEVAGTLTVDTYADIASLSASGLQYPLVDGTQRQVLSTDGAGELYWATIDTYRLANGTSNVTVTGPGPDHPTDPGGNVTISVRGTGNVVVISDTSANITGNLKVSGSTNTGNLVIGNSKVGAATITTSSIATADIVALPVANFRAVEFFIKGEDATATKFSVATISAVHNGTDTVEWSTYGGVHVGASTGTFDVSYDSVNSLVILHVTPSSSHSTVWTVQYRTI